MEPPVTVSADGLISVPEEPGLGHEVLWDRVGRATLWKEEWVAP